MNLFQVLHGFPPTTDLGMKIGCRRPKYWSNLQLQLIGNPAVSYTAAYKYIFVHEYIHKYTCIYICINQIRVELDALSLICIYIYAQLCVYACPCTCICTLNFAVLSALAAGCWLLACSSGGPTNCYIGN